MSTVWPKQPKISEYTVRRLSTYYRILEEVEAGRIEVISSSSLAERSGTNSAQIRKDLSYFGSFGKRGHGYRVTMLKNEIKRILGLDRGWRVVLAGAGNLGHALSSYKDFGKHGFTIVAIFDTDPEKIGRTWGGIRIYDIEDCARVIRDQKAELAVIATPKSSAEVAIGRLRNAGIRGFLNFAPGKMETSGDIEVRQVNMTVELEGLTYALTAHRG